MSNKVGGCVNQPDRHHVFCCQCGARVAIRTSLDFFCWSYKSNYKLAFHSFSLLEKGLIAKRKDLMLT